MHFVRRWCHCRKQSWKSLSGIPCSIVFTVNKKVHLDATICRHLFTAKSLYMFRASQHPSSGTLKTVTATSGIGHNTGTATSFQRGSSGHGTMSKKKITFSRCVGCQKGQEIFVLSGHFSILGRAKNRMGLSQVNKVGWSIFVMEFLDQLKCEADVVSCHVSRFEAPFLWKIFSSTNLHLQSVALFPYSYSIFLLLLSHLIFDVSAPRFLLCPHLHLSSELLAAHFLGRLANLLALPWTACAI